jgi:hypothetical protein
MRTVNYKQYPLPTPVPAVKAPVRDLVEDLEFKDRSNYVLVHRNWRFFLVLVFVLAKVFLAAAVYMYAKNQFLQQQIETLQKK